MNIKDKIIEAKKKGYYVDNNGNVFSKRKQLSLINSKSYYLFSFRSSTGRTTIPLHKFVAYLKYGDEVFKKNIVVRHFDRNSLNNSWDNILIGTSSQNRMDVPEAIRIRSAIQASVRGRRFSDDEVHQIQQDRILGLSYSSLCKKYNTNKSTLSYFFNVAYYSGARTIDNI